MADILREEMMQHRNCSFNGSVEYLENLPLLQFFLTHLLFGRHVMNISGMLNEELDKTVDVACKFIIQNTRSDRQVNHQPKKNDLFQHTVQTPLSIGLPHAIHSRVRDKNLANNFSEVYIVSDYRRILDLEKRVEPAVLQRMNFHSLANCFWEDNVVRFVFAKRFYELGIWKMFSNELFQMLAEVCRLINVYLISLQN